ncbi:MAG: hypothetical protein MUF34_30755 [Polyangiaceae bacterium]|jgi:predicted transcriptional regulator|nr:hypothetical protein [Polyangiaceae bacterium]
MITPAKVWPTYPQLTRAQSAERDARLLAEVEAGKTQKEIAIDEGMSQARVCQLLARARARRAEASAVGKGAGA